jgi:hypothetical protein
MGTIDLSRYCSDKFKKGKSAKDKDANAAENKLPYKTMTIHEIFGEDVRIFVEYLDGLLWVAKSTLKDLSKFPNGPIDIKMCEKESNEGTNQGATKFLINSSLCADSFLGILRWLSRYDKPRRIKIENKHITLTKKFFKAKSASTLNELLFAWSDLERTTENLIEELRICPEIAKEYQAQEAVEQKKDTGTNKGQSETAREIVSLDDFMQRHCQLYKGIDLKSRKQALYKAHKAGTITLPRPARRHAQGKSNVYYADELIAKWSEFSRQLSLPLLQSAEN